MAKHHQALLLLVATVVALVCTRVQAWGSVKVVRKFQDISSSYVYVQQALWFAMQEYNKASNDMYFFKVMEILKTQEQVTDSLDYLLEVKIARTMCKKVSGENENCLFQQDPQMQKMLFCTFIVSSKPWKFELTVVKQKCQDI
ncbi:cystatin-13-like [Ochotona curzoniae]|uniref:cystatin-13-like n=1 Tax=Ochotona curzoniae TaxID=130825 RepID=UPI001B34937E|nr:cystatin-13-like [Ochotona curzoniae]